MLNREWHLKHLLGKGAPLDARVKWHREHEKNCDCREVPANLRELVGPKPKKKAKLR